MASRNKLVKFNKVRPETWQEVAKEYLRFIRALDLREATLKDQEIRILFTR